jgi:predicted nucleic acid-binding protein
MAYLVDSDVISSYLDGEVEAIKLVEGLLPAGVSMSTVTYMETMQGVLRRHGPNAPLESFHQGIAALSIVPFDEAIAARCARMRYELAQQGKRVRQRALDLMIAATAIEHNLVLVTRNRADYADIPGLVIH